MHLKKVVFWLGSNSLVAGKVSGIDFTDITRLKKKIDSGAYLIKKYAKEK